MTKENQKILFYHYTVLANNTLKMSDGRDFKPVIRENAKKHAEQIKKSYDFSEKENKPVSKKEKN